MSKEFTVTRPLDNVLPSKNGVWIDGARRRWRVLEILSEELFPSFRGMRIAIRFVAEAL